MSRVSALLVLILCRGVRGGERNRAGEDSGSLGLFHAFTVPCRLQGAPSPVQENAKRLNAGGQAGGDGKN